MEHTTLLHTLYLKAINKVWVNCSITNLKRSFLDFGLLLMSHLKLLSPFWLANKVTKLGLWLSSFKSHINTRLREWLNCISVYALWSKERWVVLTVLMLSPDNRSVGGCVFVCSLLLIRYLRGTMIVGLPLYFTSVPHFKNIQIWTNKIFLDSVSVCCGVLLVLLCVTISFVLLRELSGGFSL